MHSYPGALDQLDAELDASGDDVVALVVGEAHEAVPPGNVA